MSTLFRRNNIVTEDIRFYEGAKPFERARTISRDTIGMNATIRLSNAGRSVRHYGTIRGVRHDEFGYHIVVESDNGLVWDANVTYVERITARDIL